MQTTKFKKQIRTAEPYFSPEEQQEILREVPGILTEQLSMGKHVAAFEKEFAQKFDATFAVALNSCTSALEIALSYLNLKADDEVIVPSQTFVATGMAVHLSGAKIVFAEIDPGTFCLDFEDVKRKVTSRTKAVIIVHFVGTISPDILELRKFCDDRRIFLIEDAAHAPGATIDGRFSGTIGHAGCFSFFPTKILTCGEGGMLTTQDDNMAAYARSMQHRGRDMNAATEQYSHPGRNVRMPEFSALLGRTQLRSLDENLATRRRHAARYHAAFANDKIHPAGASFWKYLLLLDSKIDRDRALVRLQESGIFADKSYDPPVHLQPFFAKNYTIQKGHLPVTEEILAHHICLPCHNRLSDDDIEFVIKAMTGIL